MERRYVDKKKRELFSCLITLYSEAAAFFLYIKC